MNFFDVINMDISASQLTYGEWVLRVMLIFLGAVSVIFILHKLVGFIKKQFAEIDKIESEIEQKEKEKEEIDNLFFLDLGDGVKYY